MDTGSHLLFGATLSGIALFHPAVAQDPALSSAVVAASLIGSHAPDFDSAMRLFGREKYLKHHRGVSHSIPAWFLWSGAIGALTAWAAGEMTHMALLISIAFAAVVIHVLFDYTNGYGVQWLRPFSGRWLHLDTLTLTDPWLFCLHASAAIAAIYGEPLVVSWTCLSSWAATVIYVAWRIAHHRLVVRRVRRRFRRWRSSYVLPGLWWFRWQYVVQTDKGFETGTIEGRRWLPSATVPVCEEHACVEASRRADAVRTLRGFAKKEYVSWAALSDGGYVVTWTDMRFWRPGEWPYRARVTLDERMNIVREELGWHKKTWEAPFV
ncbi:metal-dependent hydrolase [Cohnella suwonensis]|uniref:Metal-dependent hydrolase n=1 Tax=Cohnella suwonensis TaxID=696072 RepID=A0ABW0LRJ7_9BACL